MQHRPLALGTDGTLGAPIGSQIASAGSQASPNEEANETAAKVNEHETALI
jgi:hypothetical protein